MVTAHRGDDRRRDRPPAVLGGRERDGTWYAWVSRRVKPLAASAGQRHQVVSVRADTVRQLESPPRTRTCSGGSSAPTAWSARGLPGGPGRHRGPEPYVLPVPAV